MRKACYNSKQNTASSRSIHSKQFLYKKNFKQSNFIHLFCEACNGVKLVHRRHVSKRALITSWIQNCPFHSQTFTYQHNLRIFYAHEVSCNTYKAKQNEETNFHFGGHEVL